MAIQKKTKNDFLSRSDALAAKLGCKIEELTQVFDVSRATLYAYRSGARDPSGKVLARLSQKETELDLPRPVESVSSEPPIIRPCYIPDSLIDKCENMLESLKKGQAITAEVLWEAIKEDVTKAAKIQRDAEQEQIAKLYTPPKITGKTVLAADLKNPQPKDQP